MYFVCEKSETVVCLISWEILPSILIYRLIIDNNETNTNTVTLLHAHPCTSTHPNRMTLVHSFWFLRHIQTVHWRISWLFHLHVFGMPWVPDKHNNDARLMWKNEYDGHECVRVKWNYAVTYDFIRRFTENRTQFPSPNCVHRKRAIWRHRHWEWEIFLWIQMRFKTKLYCVKAHISEMSDLLTSKRHDENVGER